MIIVIYHDDDGYLNFRYANFDLWDTLSIIVMTSNVWNFNSQSVCMYNEFALVISLQLYIAM